jgi:glycerophosphoryl diester phosphodiesterase
LRAGVHNPKLVVVGHRGCGKNKSLNKGEAIDSRPSIRENTIASFNQAARNGADYVEFDVQVTKDRHAIIFHDDYIIVEDKVLSQDSVLIVILNIIANTCIWKLFRLIAGLGHTGSCNLCTMKLWRLQSIGEIGGTKFLHQSVLITWMLWCCCTGSKENWGYYIGRISCHGTSKEFC